MTKPRPQCAGKPAKEDLTVSGRDHSALALDMMKRLEAEKKKEMKTVFMDGGRTMIAATKDRLNEIVDKYYKRKF